MTQPTLPFHTDPRYESSVSLGLYGKEWYTRGEIDAASTRSAEVRGSSSYLDIENAVQVDIEGVGFGYQKLTLVTLGTSRERPTLSDCLRYHSRLNKEGDTMRHAGLTDLTPEVGGGVGAPDEDAVGRLLVRVSTQRYGVDDFRHNAQRFIGPKSPAEGVLSVDKDGADTVGWFTSQGATLSDWTQVDKDAWGPGGKSVTTIEYDAVTVEEPDYQRWLSAEGSL